jgi:hypothetical protein
MKKSITLYTTISLLFFAPMLFASHQPLPNNIIPAASTAGIALFNRSHATDYFWRLENQFVTQKNQTYCSIASSVMVLNALNIPAPQDLTYAPHAYFTQDNFFTPAVEKVLPSALVKKQGSSLAQLSQALATFAVTVKTFHSNETSLTEFRQLAKKVIQEKSGYIIVNFSRTSLGETGGGHLSPLAAYDENTDRFLMLDVARYRYPPAWIKTQDLWNAMNTMDKPAAAFRGFVVVYLKRDLGAASPSANN